MSARRERRRLAGLCASTAAALCVLLVAACSESAPASGAGGASKSAASAAQKPVASAAAGAGSSLVNVPPRTPQLPTFPCVEQCHKDRVANATPRLLTEFHSTKRIQHGDEHTWCDRCHDLSNTNQLRLLDGRGVSFDQAFELCGQCHGPKLRDWNAGIHGLQTGSWNGVKVRRNCTACHDPHAPKRPTFEALPAPTLERKVSHE